MVAQSPNPPAVFVSYAREDEKDKDELIKQLNVLEEQGVISSWHDGLLVAGEQWDETIVQQINIARVILLLVSPDFLNSKYIHNVEMKRASERHQAGEVVVIPVLVRNINSWENVPFGALKLGKLNALPTGAQFISHWDDEDDAFADIAKGIQRAVEKLNERAVEQLKITASEPPTPANLPPSPVVDFVARKGRDDRDIVERLQEELTPPSQRLIALIGDGGVGKTTLAAEAVRVLAKEFAGRIVWVSAEKSATFTFSTLLDEIAAQLGDRELSRLAPEQKAEAVRALIAADATLIVLDNFETVSANEQTPCANFLATAHCPALITSRQLVRAARPLYVDAMTEDEAQEFLEKLIEQMSDPTVFSDEVRQRIIQTADARPYVMQWVTAQIDQEAQEPDVILEELSRGEGDAAERVFDRSYNLPQLGDDGRAALLALSLFTPSATRNALAAVAGFENDLKRVNTAITSLRALMLVKGTDGNRRLAIEGLTRSLAKARLAKDDRAAEFRQQFVAHFLSYAEAHAQKTGEDFDELEAEKDNVLGAMDVAYEMKDRWSVMRIRVALEEFLVIRGYWDEAIQRGEQAMQAARYASSETGVAAFAHNVATIHQRRGDLKEARRLYDESLEINKRLNDQSGIANTLHQLAMLAQHQGDVAEARRLYDESLEINKNLDNQSGIANTLHQLGRLAQAQGELTEARRLYDESIVINKNLGNQSGVANTMYTLANVLCTQGELIEARQLYEESLAITERLGDKNNLALIFLNLGVLEEEEDNREEAIRLTREALSIFEKLKSSHAETARQNLEILKSRSS
jgi:tetratricopeptide (TPR) repeat protein